jgi:sigma-B regulation protein RsbU (phosphoserine phosphatase)
MLEAKRLTEKLKQRDFKLNALLDITTAINENRNVERLLEQYEKVLRSQLSIEKLMLFTREDKWKCILKYGVKEGEIHDIDDDSFLISEVK